MKSDVIQLAYKLINPLVEVHGVKLPGCQICYVNVDGEAVHLVIVCCTR